MGLSLLIIFLGMGTGLILGAGTSFVLGAGTGLGHREYSVTTPLLMLPPHKPL